MSMLNLFLEKDRVRVFTDTIVYEGNDPVDFTNKYVVNERLNAVMAGRGRLYFLEQAFDLFDSCETIEGAAYLAKLVLSDAVPVDGEDMHNEITIAWVDESGSHAIQVAQDGSDVELYSYEPGAYLSPYIDTRSIPADLTNEKVMKVAEIQAFAAKKHGISLCFGGEGMLCTVTRDGITQENLGRFSDYSLTDARIQKQKTPQPMEHAA